MHDSDHDGTNRTICFSVDRDDLKSDDYEFRRITHLENVNKTCRRAEGDK